MKLYLSGPMTGVKDFNFPLFNRVAGRLRRKGYEVTNPAENFGGKSDAGDWAFYLRHDLKQLLECEGVAVLPGWRDSRGASLEVHVANALGMPILDSTTLGPVTESVCREADRLVNGSRQSDYDHPLDNFRRTALIWEAILGIPVSEEQVGLCMVGVKLAREAHRPKRDNRVDGAGYFETVDMVHVERERRTKEES